VILPKGNISKRHSRIVVKDGKFIIVDLKSTNGTYVNGKKITAPQVVKSTDKIYIGDFTIQVASGNGAAAAAEPREASAIKPKAPQKEEEIDLFGGDASPDLDAPSPAASKSAAASPGLIDDNFDQEFDAPESPKGGKGAAKKAAPAKAAPKAAEIELEDDFGGGGADIELDAPPDEPEPEPEPPKAAPPKAATAAPKKAARTPTPAPARANLSKIKPAATPVKKGAEIELEDDFGGGPDIADEPDALAPMTMTPQPAAAAPIAAGPAVVHSIAAAAPAAEPMGYEELGRHLLRTAVEGAGLRGILPAQLSNGANRGKAVEVILAEAERLKTAGRLPAGATPAELADSVASYATDLSPILDLIQDEEVVEIMIAHDRTVLADRKGMLEPTDSTLRTEAEVIELITKLGVLGGADPGVEHPLVDVRLRDGARVVAALPPLAFRGPTLTYRKTTRDFLTLERLKEDYSSLSQGMLTFVDYCVRFRKNVLLSLGPGVNASGTLNALLAQMPVEDRIVTIENGVELHVGEHKHVTALEPRAGLTSIALAHHALRLQADRVVLGHLGGVGTSEILELLAGSLEGSVAAYPSATPALAIDRLAKVELRARFEGAPEEARRLIAAALPVVIQEQKFSDNSRRLVTISELVVDESGEVRVEDIFRFKAAGVDENLLVTGSFHPTGHVPRFLEELVDRGEAEIDLEIFKE
jgi:pilus assembly protein CpaF